MFYKWLINCQKKIKKQEIYDNFLKQESNCDEYVSNMKTNYNSTDG